MKGDLADITTRLQRALPSGWYPSGSVNTDGSVSRVWVSMLGFASALIQMWSQLQFAALQTRTITSSEGWLDLKAWDYFGWGLVRTSGETDDALKTRIGAMLLQPANTRAALSNAIAQLCGTIPRIMEPWNPSDNGVLDGPGMYLDVDSTLSPARMVDPQLRNQFFIETIPPVLHSTGNASVPAYDAASYLDVWNAALIDLTTTETLGLTEVYALLSRLKAEGVVGWINIITPGSIDTTLQVFELDFSMLDDPSSVLG